MVIEFYSCENIFKEAIMATITTKIKDTCRWEKEPGNRTQEGQRCDRKPENIDDIKGKLKSMMMVTS